MMSVAEMRCLADDISDGAIITRKHIQMLIQISMPVDLICMMNAPAAKRIVLTAIDQFEENYNESTKSKTNT